MTTETFSYETAANAAPYPDTTHWLSEIFDADKSGMPGVNPKLWQAGISQNAFTDTSSEVLMAQASLQSIEAETLAQTGTAKAASPERQALEAQARTQIKGRDLSGMLSNMDTFEKRARDSRLTEGQINKTYEHLTRLLNYGQGATLPVNERVKIAQQIIANAAKPTGIDQGHHGTCNVNVVESRVYTNDPEKAAGLVVDIATTGSFRTKDGTAITPTMRSLTADDEARSNPPSDGKRSYASQIFQLTAANIKWQRTIVTPDRQISSRGKITYEQIPNKRSRLTGDTGERVLDYNASPPRETTNYKQGPALSVSDLPDIANQITGKNDTGFVIENKINAGRFTEHVSSPAELEKAIVEAEKNGQFPLLIRVHTGNDPFLTDSGGGYSRQRGVWHVVSITAYNKTTRKATIDNQWGSRSDKSVALEKLYKATMEPGTDEWKKKHELFLQPSKGIGIDLESLSPFSF
ncbi:MAG: hypothetical protein K8F91_05450 [Candidatus Obscuribacterales bacterium]|nr:hypothetical protein [Candidatus Obscuribacterales bacterium]